MGAIPIPGGTAFRVWAPFATSVHVKGTFNGWSQTATPLTAEGNGHWSADTTAQPGDQYRYIIRNGDKELSKNDPRARELTHSVGVTIVPDHSFDWQGDPFTLPAWNDLVIYEVHVGTFNDEPGGPVGQLRSVQARLDYLRELGINAIELMPLMEFAMDYSWGYNVAHPFAVERAYGGPTALKELVREAHRQGIGVMLDVVYNHFGPSDLDLWQFDGWSKSNHGGIYFYNDDRRHTPWGDTRPDYGRPEVRQYLRDNARMWFEEYHIDGLRFDATVCIRKEKGFCGGHCCGRDLPDGWRLLQEINDEVRTRFPGKITIAEDLQGNDWITRDTASGGAGMGAQWTPEFVHPIRAALIEGRDEHRDLGSVVAAVLHRYGSDAFQRIVYTESHDEVANGRSRLPQEIDQGQPASVYAKKRSTLGAALVFTAPGIPMLFQGQELLEDEYFRDTDPIDWTKLERFAGIHRLYRDLIRLRRNGQQNTRGLRGQHVHVFHINHWDKVLAYHRWQEGGPGDDVIVVLNFSHRAYPAYRLGYPRAGTWHLRFNSDSPTYDSHFGVIHSYNAVARPGGQDGLAFHGDVGLPPYAALIFSQ
jgi:1,4-alpha-glucan branching enzyme